MFTNRSVNATIDKRNDEWRGCKVTRKVVSLLSKKKTTGQVHKKAAD